MPRSLPCFAFFVCIFRILLFLVVMVLWVGFLFFLYQGQGFATCQACWQLRSYLKKKDCWLKKKTNVYDLTNLIIIFKIDLFY